MDPCASSSPNTWPTLRITKRDLIATEDEDSRELRKELAHQAEKLEKARRICACKSMDR